MGVVINKDKELEEEIKNYIQKEYPDGIGFPNVPKIAHHFAEWSRQQMIKDAMEGEYWIGEIHLDIPIIQGYNDGDTIKFIPIKEEQQ
jgi:hypothetical protein